MNLRVLIIACAAGLSGCASTGPGVVAGLGATAGGGEVAAGIVEAMAGGIIAGTADAELDRGERRKALEAEYRALEHTPSGQTVTWRGSDEDRYGEVVAAQPYRVGSQDCRQYTHTVHVGAAQKTARGTACRNADGRWMPLT